MEQKFDLERYTVVCGMYYFVLLSSQKGMNVKNYNQ